MAKDQHFSFINSFLHRHCRHNHSISLKMFPWFFFSFLFNYSLNLSFFINVSNFFEDILFKRFVPPSSFSTRIINTPYFYMNRSFDKRRQSDIFLFLTSHNININIYSFWKMTLNIFVCFISIIY